MIVFERLVGENDTSSGEAFGVQVKCAVLLEGVPPELRTHLLLTCGSRRANVIMRQTVGSYSVMAAIQRNWVKRRWKSTLCMETKAKKGKHAKGKKGKDKGKGKHKG